MGGQYTLAPLPSRAQLEAALGQALAGGAAARPDVDAQRIVAVYLFGSVARGTAGRESDIDLGLLYAEAPGSRLEDQPFALEAELSQALRRKVQCVVMNLAPADLVHRILRDQQLLIDRDPGLRIRFEVAARNRYFDVRPLQVRYRRGGHAA
jgi:uncharacterized protein